MTYPEAVDRFVEKLNKADTVYVIEDEELVLEDGIFEGELAHDNVKNDSVMVFTEPKLSGERIENFFLSIPSDAPWKRIIKVFANVPKVYVTYETIGDQVEAEDINRVQESIVNTQKEVERYKAANDQVVSDLGTRLSTVESKKADKTYVDTELLKKADKENTYTKAETDSRIQAIIGAAPEALDTLAEIAEALNNDPDFAATITNMLAQKVDKVAGMGLSEANFTNEEKTKLSNIEEGANKYIHPSTHPASMIVETSEKRFVSDIEKAAWNAKETPAGAQEKANIAEQNAKSYTDEHDQNTTKHITATERTNWNDANAKKHTHSNKSTLDIITQTLINAWNSAVDHISDAVKHITAEERTRWNAKQDALGYTPVNKAGDTMTGTLVIDGKNLPSSADIVTLRRGSGTNRFVLETQDKDMQAFLEAGASMGLMGTITASDFRIRTNYLDRMSVSGSNGDVGIGTTSPSQKLDVNGKIRMRLQTQASDADDIVATKKYVDTKTDDLAGEGRTTETVKEVADDLVSHKANTANPHNVTKAQVGLANVDNVKQASKTEFDSHNNDTTRHITSAERTAWNNKAEVSQIPTKVSQLENDRRYVTQEELGDAGYGDMLKSIYDTNNDGIVDNADKLDGKHASDFALASHTHTADAITGNLETTKLTEPSYVTGNVTITSKPLFDVLRADRTAFLPASQIIIEQSIDGGVTWEDAGISDTNKARLFTGQRPSIAIPRKDGMKNTDCMLRITITGMKYNVPPGTAETAKYNYWNSNYVTARERYFLAEDAWLWVTAGPDRIYCKVERATGANPNDWITVREAFLSGWSGGNYIKLGFNFGGGTSQTGNNWNWRFTFRTATTSNDFDNAKLNQTYITSSQTIHHIKISGRNVHNSSNNLMYHDHLYTWDENQNAIFPANVTASDFYVGSNKVWHAGNFDPDTKLNKGPITWNQLKGVI